MPIMRPGGKLTWSYRQSAACFRLLIFWLLVIGSCILLSNLIPFLPRSASSSTSQRVNLPTALNFKPIEDPRPSTDHVAPPAWATSLGKTDYALFVMSHCPDAKLCERVFYDLMDQTDNNSPPPFSIRLEYFGALNEAGQEPSCPHGQSECDQNKIQLCATHLYPDTRRALKYLECYNSQGQWKGDFGVQVCLNHTYQGMTYVDRILSCAKSAMGAGLLEASVSRTVALAPPKYGGVFKSCTVVRGGGGHVKMANVECVVDSGIWSGACVSFDSSDTTFSPAERARSYFQTQLNAKS